MRTHRVANRPTHVAFLDVFPNGAGFTGRLRVLRASDGLLIRTVWRLPFMHHERREVVQWAHELGNALITEDTASGTSQSDA